MNTTYDFIVIAIILLFVIYLIWFYIQNAIFFYNTNITDTKYIGLILNLIVILAIILLPFIRWNKYSTVVLGIITIVSIFNMGLLASMNGKYSNQSDQDKANSLFYSNEILAIGFIFVVFYCLTFPFSTFPDVAIKF